jgi:hypothetical protein
MRKFVFFLFISFISTTIFGQTATVKFDVEEYNFGKIKQNVPVNYDFKFKNISKAPVIIENASASCGCTTPTWPKTPVMPNKANTIKAGFNAATVGTFEKTITITIKGSATPKVIKIKGEVLTPEDYAKLPAKGKVKKVK